MNLIWTWLVSMHPTASPLCYTARCSHAWRGDAISKSWCDSCHRLSQDFLLVGIVHGCAWHKQWVWTSYLCLSCLSWQTCTLDHICGHFTKSWTSVATCGNMWQCNRIVPVYSHQDTHQYSTIGQGHTDLGLESSDCPIQSPHRAKDREPKNRILNHIMTT